MKESDQCWPLAYIGHSPALVKQMLATCQHCVCAGHLPVLAMTDEPPSRSLDKIVIRVPNGLRDRIAAAAKESHRSVNAELVELLERTYPPPTADEDMLWAVQMFLSTMKSTDTDKSRHDLYESLFHYAEAMKFKKETGKWPDFWDEELKKWRGDILF